MAEDGRGAFSEAGWSRVRGLAPALAERAQKLFGRRSAASMPPSAPAGAEAVSAIEVR